MLHTACAAGLRPFSLPVCCTYNISRASTTTKNASCSRVKRRRLRRGKISNFMVLLLRCSTFGNGVGWWIWRREGEERERGERDIHTVHTHKPQQRERERDTHITRRIISGLKKIFTFPPLNGTIMDQVMDDFRVCMLCYVCFPKMIKRLDGGERSEGRIFPD